MAEKFNWRKFHSTISKEGTPEKIPEVTENIIKRDKAFTERKAHLVAVVRELILSEGIQDPNKQLTLKFLQKLIDSNPTKFIGLKNTDAILKTYFMGSLYNLKFSLGLIKE